MPDAAGIGAAIALDRFQQRGLASPVWTKEGDNFAGLDSQADPVECHGRAVANDHIRYFEYCHGCNLPPKWS